MDEYHLVRHENETFRHPVRAARFSVGYVINDCIGNRVTVSLYRCFGKRVCYGHGCHDVAGSVEFVYTRNLFS
jgi:hypothetical protein